MELGTSFRTASTLLLFVGTAACGSPVDQDDRRVIGVVDAGGIGVDALIVPDTVRAGVPFTATVSTFGNSCIRPDGAVVDVTALVATITPYDIAPPPESICTADVRAFPRPVTLTLPTSGAGLVRLQGRGFRDTTVTIVDTVTVRP